MTKKDIMLRLDEIDNEICKLMEEAERIKKLEQAPTYDKKQFENLINTYEDSSETVQHLFITYLLDTTSDYTKFL
jgi:archaellum component FlaC